MRPTPDIQFDVASAISQGRRDYQEDAIITDFPLGSEVGFAVLADGMGGHAAGDVASKIVVTEVFSELKIQSGDQGEFEKNISDILLDAALAANDCVHGHVGVNPETAGMGATLVAPVFVRDLLYWISIGDSPLFLFRNGALKQLNEDHSMAPQIDLMVASGMIAADVGACHPDRNCLTSVLIGNEIPRIDCPKTPIKLLHGDVLIVASDGLQFLDDSEIEHALSETQGETSYQISENLLAALTDLGDPDQDNISFSVIKISHKNHCENGVVKLRDNPSIPAQVAFSSGRQEPGKTPVPRHAVVRPANLFRDLSDVSDGSL